MAFVSPISVIYMALLIVSILLPLRFNYYLLVIFAPFTTTAIFFNANSFISLPQILWLILTIKLIPLYLKVKQKKPYIIFVIYAIISCMFAFLNTNVLVTNIDGKLSYINPSVQQLTQWTYLILAVACVWHTKLLLKCNIVEVDYIVRCLKIGFVIVLAIGIAQNFIPVSVVNQYIRNAPDTGYNYEGARISSTFGEPSFLSAYLIPMLCFCFFDVRTKRINRFLFVLFVLILCLNNSSSSSLIGFMIMAMMYIINFFISIKHYKISKYALIFIPLIFICLILLIENGTFNQIFIDLINKLNGKTGSGVIRWSNIEIAFNAFKDSPLFGVGWGTIRVESLFVTWLAELGIVGVSIFLIASFRMLIRLMRSQHPLRMSIFSSLMCAWIVMFIAVPEPYYFSIWLIFGLGDWLSVQS